MRRGTALAGSAIFLVIAPGTVMFLHPMYVAGVLIITGQALFFGNLRVLAYVFGVWLIFHLFVLFYEEPCIESLALNTTNTASMSADGCRACIPGKTNS